MDWLFVISSIIMGWAMLRLMGNERHRRVLESAAVVEAERAAAAQNAASARDVPIVS